MRCDGVVEQLIRSQSSPGLTVHTHKEEKVGKFFDDVRGRESEVREDLRKNTVAQITTSKNLLD